MENELLEIGSSEKKAEHRALINHMEAMLNNVEQSLVRHECCVYKVPKKLRQVNEAAYTPRVVSIGPLHYGDERLKPMEEHKLGYLKGFLQRTDIKLEDIIHILKENEALIRGCYAQNIPQSSDDFASMILIDACFIIEYFFRWHEDSPWCTIDPILSKPWLTDDVWLDLILLENQLPFFVFEDLFTPTFRSTIYSSFLELSFYFFGSENEELTFDNFLQQHLMKRQSNGEYEHIEVKHFTDLTRILKLPHLRCQPEREMQEVKHLHSASQLLKARVKFKVSENKSIIELQFENHVLTIPCLGVFDETETVLRNIVALEQCHYPYDAYIIDYIQLLNFLINNSKDVDVLVDNGIMTNWVEDNNKVAAMINHLLIVVIVTNTSATYVKLCHKLNDFCNRPSQKWKAMAWKIVSFFAATVLLLLTLIQTICSIISLVQAN